MLRNSRDALRRGAKREMANSLSCRAVSPDASCAVKYWPVGSSTMLDRSLNVHFTAPSSNTMPRTSDGLPLSAFTLGLGFDGDSMTRDLVREGTTTASGRIDEGFGGVSRGHPSRSNGGLGAVWRGIGPPELAGISSTPADTPSARALRLVRWVVCWPRFKLNRLAVGGRRGESGRAT